MKPIRWGIIGPGRFGAIHAATLQSLFGCELAAICHHNREKLRQAQAAFPDVAATTNYQELLARQDIDVISITTHWQQHFEIAKEALQSGKHVFLEKPMAATFQQCAELVAIAERSLGFLMVGHVCRFDPRASLAREAIVAGRIGRIVSMHAKRNLPKAPGHIRLDKISPLMGDGVHDADLMLWFMQQLPTRVYARTVKADNFHYPDLGWAMLEFGDSAVGVIETIWCLPQSVPTVIDARLEVVGTEGMLTVDCSDTGLRIVDEFGNRMLDTVYWPEQHGRRTGALADELAYFADCIRRGEQPTVITPQEAANAVRVMETAEASALSGQPIAIEASEHTA